MDESREGPSAIRNRLAESSDADWFLPLDDDDVLEPDCVELLLAASDNADVVYPWCRVEDHDDGLEPWAPNRLFRPEPLMNFNYIPVTALISSQLWRDVGGMPQEKHGEDWIFWRRCVAEGARFRCVPEVLWVYRRSLSGSRNKWTN
jgi:glycosyltransferase involved in cell wall biosynthesis